MSNPSYVKVSATQAADVATNGTITLAYPSGYTSANIKATGSKLWAEGLNNMFSQGTSNFSVAYGGTIVITYLGATTIPAGTRITYYLAVPDAEDAITDSTGGTASLTLAVITNPAANATTSLTADVLAIKNALATLAAELNKIKTAIKNANINPV